MILELQANDHSSRLCFNTFFSHVLVTWAHLRGTESLQGVKMTRKKIWCEAK